MQRSNSIASDESDLSGAGELSNVSENSDVSKHSDVSKNSDVSEHSDVSTHVSVPSSPTERRKLVPQIPKKRRAGKRKTKVSELFVDWVPKVNVPPPNAAYGTKPYPGPGGPKPHLDSPPARTSNAATKIPLWEDRKWKFKKGGRYQNTFYDENYVKYLDEDELEEAQLDQENNLIMSLVDMRPISLKDQNPRRAPAYYAYEGIPKDWNDKAMLHTLNDRRRDAIRRITEDPPYAQIEREYLVRLLTDHPDASITELAERFNYRFAGDIKESTAFYFGELYEKRTLESVRAEYLEHKPLYDRGIVPCPKRPENDKIAKKYQQQRIDEQKTRENFFWRLHRMDVDSVTGERSAEALELFKSTFGHEFDQPPKPKRVNKKPKILTPLERFTGLLARAKAIKQQEEAAKGKRRASA
ncbi:hypothetical protein BU24DRAFT_487505 [Aaosphaeria arxii CBS 175.79]|uniref:Uncharacterized protein n=1 Tax=Aaosphaeria arxii CBS 175.79 TaxID=1450172 RepID=A0A6A5Y6T7_9PLEO|nr:uncharacterized protein BU24DRAFT_487505 [Aaosphaeria arxii CBS 175.79]KAF2020996.1 hypothetical protein BU24DRAFT_487505 [Aaosphaeria arxii CBS 175.79]